MSRLTAQILRLTHALRLMIAMVLLFAAGVAQAVPSACTALWGVNNPNLQYWSGTTWVTAANTGLATAINSLGGFEGDGSLYFTSAVTSPVNMHKATFDNVGGTITFSASLGQVGTPTGLTYTSTANVSKLITPTTYSFVGATFDRDTGSRRMVLYANTAALPVTDVPTSGAAVNRIALIGLVDPENPTTPSWQVLYQTSGAGSITYPQMNGSGDIVADQETGQIWVVSNFNPNQMLKVAINFTGLTLNSAQVVGTATIQFPAATNLTGGQAGVGVDPTTGRVFLTTGAGGTTYSLINHTTSPVVGSASFAATGVGDTGNCVAPPDPPTVIKSFSPTTATTPGSTSLTITIVNPNKVPIFLTTALTDAFPSGLVVAPTPALSGTCFSNGAAATRPASATITGVAGATSVAIASGAMIPGGSSTGGSCSFSVRVSATVASFYNNTIPPGSLTTSAGNNAVQASATFQVQNLSLPNAPTIVKSFNPTTSTAATRGTTTLTIVITNPNTVTNTLTTALIDNLPANMRIGNPVSRSVNCFSNGVATTRSVLTTITGTINLGTATIPNGAVIPGGAGGGGSCSFSIVVSQTVAAFSLNTIPAGSLTMVSGSNPSAATAGYYLRASDFSVIKTQREGTTGVTTTAQLDVASGQTISYIISILNGGGVAGTRTFTDTLPALITPTLSLGTATFGGATGCRAITTTVAGPPASTRISGTITGAPIGGGCNITVVAKASVTGVVGTATNSVGLYTVTGALDTNTGDNTATVVLVIKPAANLSITKDDGKTVLLTGSTNAYTITVANGGPASADGAVLKDPAATGLNCTDITCSSAGGASCPLPAQLFVSALQSGTGLAIPTFPSGGTVTFVLTCSVTATGLP